MFTAQAISGLMCETEAQDLNLMRGCQHKINTGEDHTASMERTDIYSVHCVDLIS